MWKLLPAFCLALAAQTFTARLAGTITDPSGSPIPNAQITLTKTDTAVSQSTTSSVSGAYVFPSLQPGLYDVAFSAQGFQKQLQKNITLEINQAANLDSKLTLASVSTEVQVTEEFGIVP
jgi:hypothetical protein